MSKRSPSPYDRQGGHYGSRGEGRTRNYDRERDDRKTRGMIATTAMIGSQEAAVSRIVQWIMDTPAILATEKTSGEEIRVGAPALKGVIQGINP